MLETLKKTHLAKVANIIKKIWQRFNEKNRKEKALLLKILTLTNDDYICANDEHLPIA